jgi:hypothetical protein
MTVILRPLGRGNWATMILQLGGRRAPLPVEVHVGLRVRFGDQVFRVVEVRP